MLQYSKMFELDYILSTKLQLPQNLSLQDCSCAGLEKFVLLPFYMYLNTFANKTLMRKTH